MDMNPDRKERIYLSPPYQSGKEKELIDEVLDSNWLSPVGEHLNRFEQKLSDLFHFQEVVAVNSGTSALHLILRKLDVGPGDTVLVSNLTFIGGVSPILYLGAKPVFIDSSPDDWNISPELLQEYLEGNREDLPKALIVVHLFGNCCDLMKIKGICDTFGIALIEDCAEALGSKIGNEYVGTFGDYAFLSFNGNKTITTSGGGAVIAKNQEEKDYFIYLATQAKCGREYYEHEEIGFNYRMSNLLAALGLAQLFDFAERIARKRQIHDLYVKQLENLGFKFICEKAGSTSSYWLTCALVPEGFNPFTIIQYLDSKYNIEARPVWKPMHLQPVFENETSLVNGVSEKIFKQGICLPSGVGLSEEQQLFICQAIRNIISR